MTQLYLAHALALAVGRENKRRRGAAVDNPTVARATRWRVEAAVHTVVCRGAEVEDVGRDLGLVETED
jgi:hypothetical protein